MIVWECTLKIMQKDNGVKDDVEAQIEEFFNSEKNILKYNRLIERDEKLCQYRYIHFSPGWDFWILG